MRGATRKLVKLLALADSAVGFSRFFERSLGVVLMYHSIGESRRNVSGYFTSVGEFEQHMRFLLENYSVVRLRDFLDGTQGIAMRKRIAITFDDGYMDFSTDALPLLAR